MDQSAYNHLHEDEDAHHDETDELAIQLQRDSAAAIPQTAPPVHSFQIQPPNKSNDNASSNPTMTNGQFALNGSSKPPSISTANLTRPGANSGGPTDTPVSALAVHTSTDSPVVYFPHTPVDRTLPHSPFTEPDFNDAYAQFILYCNPRLPITTDTTELKSSFRSPPRSDGKTFDTYNLFQLIQQLERKELRTWTQLAIKLGVEPPQAEKNQSTQKVQQYSVRLKRWMRAMHIDAFFEFCQGKKHNYYTHIPPPEIDDNEILRDQVPPNEDLALRALKPDSRPKRGRRKTEDKDETGQRAAKNPRLDTGAATAPQFDAQTPVYPVSGVSADEQYPGGTDAWNNNNQRFSSQTPNTHARFKSFADTPSTPYPGSGPAQTFEDAPPSAIESPRSRGRPRKRHGPAVSSAWSGGTASPSGKTRGRPPQNKTYRDGPFSAFPARPAGELPTPDESSPPGQQISPSHTQQRTPGASPQTTTHPKPSALQVTVPQRPGGPVRLATPTVVVNGETAKSSSSHQRAPPQPANPHPTPTSSLTPSTGISQLRTPSTANTPSTHTLAPPSHPLSYVHPPPPSLTPSTPSSSSTPYPFPRPPSYVPSDSDLEKSLAHRLQTSTPSLGPNTAMALSRSTLAQIRRPGPPDRTGAPSRPSRLSMDTWAALMREISVTPDTAAAGQASAPRATFAIKRSTSSAATTPAEQGVTVYEVSWVVVEGAFRAAWAVGDVEVREEIGVVALVEGEEEKRGLAEWRAVTRRLEEDVRRGERSVEAIKARVMGALV
ncbi:MAG: hypothetical protein M1814_004443 [Vezdaea aestivalis]|nr:MAG: hypothetical protein M1814_004443 [Vezdaea aestivalis]